MDEWNVKINDNGTDYFVKARQGDNLLETIHKTKATVHAPCGGRGTCKKCLVDIVGIGKVLSCQTLINKDLDINGAGLIEVHLPQKTKARILTEWTLPAHELNPLVEMLPLKMNPPSVQDQTPDDTRINKASGRNVPFQHLNDLSPILRDAQFYVSIVSRKDTNEIISISKPTVSNHLYGVAFDIGTTTMAALLFDLQTGNLLNMTSRLNSQKRHGADVISRIDYASKSLKNLRIMQSLVHKDIMEMLYEIIDHLPDVKMISFAGNTTMMHLLCGIDPTAIAVSPFIPTTVSSKILDFTQLFQCDEYIQHFNPICILLPSIAGYVGADVTAGILACDMDNSLRTLLLIDIGTNGEIALSVSGRIVTCSTAAGPAFEGANITCGTGGVSGAIDKVYIVDDRIEFTTIDGEYPIGICGSGIVSAVASLLKLKLIDETGRFTNDLDIHPKLVAENLIEINKERAYVFSYNTDHKPEVYLTQRDIREIQNAKAAVCAGIRLLLKKESINESQIEEVYISGGFGNYLNVEDALTIGLIPLGLRGKILMKGNTSITGSLLCLLDYENLFRCEEIRKKTLYYELSSDKAFSDLYIDEMVFEVE
jgi:uncharacterized 2Fe-2S/4Fe-4S cluster protein (DUF4445 family)